MKYLIHTEFPPVNLERCAYVQKVSSHKIMFYFGGESAVEWDFKTEDVRNRFYLKINEIILKEGGEMLV